MKCGKIMIPMIMSAVFLGVVFLCWAMTPPADETAPTAQTCGLSLRLANNGGDAGELKLWQNQTGDYFAFLPGHSRMEEAQLVVKPGYRVTLSGETLQSGMSCQGFSAGVRYALEWESDDGGGNSGITFYEGSDLPAVYVDVTSGSMEYIHSYKGAQEPGTMRIVLPDGNVHYRGSLETVTGRGNSTWEKHEKKPYNLRLRIQADLLGMGQAQNWVLLANAYDDSHLRNKIVYETAEKLDLAYSPQCRWVELYLNGEYAGLYLLCEKNEIHESRVDIDGVNGNLISMEKEDRLWTYDQQFVTQGGTAIRIRETADPEKLQETIGCLERAILADNGVDPVSGASWLQMIDLESWVKKYLIEEAFGNLDAGSISQFFYWENGGKIFAGPVWDYDISMGSDEDWQLQDVNMLYAGRPHLWNSSDAPWYYSLWRKPEFQAELEQIYAQQLRPLLLSLAGSGVANHSEAISEEARRNQIRWDTEDAEEVTEQMLSYLRERIGFLDGLWLGEDNYYLVQLHVNWVVMGCYAIMPGETVPEQSVPENWEDIVYLGWYDMDTGRLYDFSRPVTRDLYLYLKEEVREEETALEGSVLSGKIWLIPGAAFTVIFGAIAAVEIVRNRKCERKHVKKRKVAQGHWEAL